MIDFSFVMFISAASSKKWNSTCPSSSEITACMLHSMLPLWDWVSFTDVALVDVWRDNHVLIFYAIIYYHYAEYTDELQFDDLQVAG
jgi:hypothetical protein